MNDYLAERIRSSVDRAWDDSSECVSMGIDDDPMVKRLMIDLLEATDFERWAKDPLAALIMKDLLQTAAREVLFRMAENGALPEWLDPECLA